MIGAQSDRLINAQLGVLGSMLLDGALAGQVMFRVQDEDFTDPMYRSVYVAIKELFSEGKGADPILLIHKLRTLGDKDAYRKLVYEIIQITPTSSHCMDYVDVLLEESKIHRVRMMLDMERLPQTMDDVRHLADELTAITCERAGLRILTMQDGLVDFLDRQDKRNKREYLTWGFHDLDTRLYAEGGDFVVLGGYPSAGKTALAIQLACHMAGQKRVGFFSLETKDKKLYERMMAHVAKMPLAKIKRQELDTGDFEAIASLEHRIVARQLEFVEAAGMTVQEIQAIALSRRYEVVFVDYLQLIAATGYNRTEEVTKISMALHTMASRTGMTVVALSQLTRPEKGQGKQQAPNMSSFRESGQIEQDADIAMLLYLKEPEDNRSPRWLKVSKNKEGEKLKLLLEFNGAVQTFVTSYREQTPQTEPGKPKKEKYKQVELTELPPDTELPF